MVLLVCLVAAAGIVPPAVAVRGPPHVVQRGFLTVAVASWLRTGPQKAVVYGVVRSYFLLPVRIVSAAGTVSTLDGSILGKGELAGTPLELPPFRDVPAQANLVSLVVPESVNLVKLDAVRVRATMIYMVDTLWFSYVSPFTATDEETVTREQAIEYLTG